jgi:hypothetical protein
MSEQETRRKRVYELYLENKSKGRNFTVQHFSVENIHESTIYRIIDRAEQGSGYKRVDGSGRVAKIMTPKNIERLKSMFDNKDNISQNQVAKKFVCSQQHVSKTLKTKTKIRKRKKIKIPARTEAQKLSIRGKCARLYKKLAENLCIMDDESYFTLKHSSINGNGIFYTSNVSRTPSNVKHTARAKFEQKLLVWICISERGMAQPYAFFSCNPLLREFDMSMLKMKYPADLKTELDS